MKEYKHPQYSFVDVTEFEKSEIKKIDIASCRQPTETVGSYYNRQAVKPKLLINGGFFSRKTGDPNFNFIDEGKVIASNESINRGFGIRNSNKSSFEFGIAKDYIVNDWTDFITGYPVLLDGHGPITSWSLASEINYNAMRTIVGYNDNSVFFVTIDKPGMAFNLMSEMMYNLGCSYAINVDGGGSTYKIVDGKVMNKPTENRSVDSVIAVYAFEDMDHSEQPTKPAKPVPEVPYIEHTVKYGDSLYKIAVEYLGKGSRYKEIMLFNNIYKTTLRVGQVLKIPVDCYKYTVSKGDTLWGIAARNLGSGAKYRELAEFNHIDPKESLSVGQILYIKV